MSIQAMNWVIEHSPNDLKTGEYLVMLMIANHLGRTGEAAFPSLPVLAGEARLSKQQTITCLKRLEAKKEIAIEVGGGRGNLNRYRLPGFETWLQRVKGLDSLDEPKRSKDLTLSGNEKGQVCTPETVKSEGVNSQVLQTPPTPPYKVEPLREPNTEPKDQQRVRADYGIRIPDDFKPKPEVYEWAKLNARNVDVVTALAEFRDYWETIPGKAGRKLDWDKTFRNRLRFLEGKSAQGRNGFAPRPQQQPARGLTTSDVQRMKDEPYEPTARR